MQLLKQVALIFGHPNDSESLQMLSVLFSRLSKENILSTKEIEELTREILRILEKHRKEINALV